MYVSPTPAEHERKMYGSLFSKLKDSAIVSYTGFRCGEPQPTATTWLGNRGEIEQRPKLVIAVLLKG